MAQSAAVPGDSRDIIGVTVGCANRSVGINLVDYAACVYTNAFDRTKMRSSLDTAKPGHKLTFIVEQSLTINEPAQRRGTGVEAIGFYESKGSAMTLVGHWRK